MRSVCADAVAAINVPIAATAPATPIAINPHGPVAAYKDLAKAIDFKQPTVESCVAYIRKKINDELEIQEWITNYVVQYRNSHNGS